MAGRSGQRYIYIPLQFPLAMAWHGMVPAKFEERHYAGHLSAAALTAQPFGFVADLSSMRYPSVHLAGDISFAAWAIGSIVRRGAAVL